jgi:uncharacterized surface protein with fasciclin (FAS1) repeats
MDVNDNAYFLNQRRALGSIASELAPTEKNFPRCIQSGPGYVYQARTDIPGRFSPHRIITMKRTSIKTPLMASLLTLALGGALALNTVQAASMGHDSVTVGGQSMLPSKDIVDNAVNSADHTTLVAAVKAAGLVDTLKGKGPFTVFAPVNSAFTALPAGTVDTLLKPENKATLTKLLTYHVVAGKLDMMTLAEKIKAGGGKTELTTVAGGKLWAMMNGPHNITIKDEKGDVADITTYDVYQSNGVIQVIDKVLMPKS